MCVFIELVLLPILAGTLANVLSEWLIRFVASKCDKKKKNSLSALNKRKKTPLAATGGVFLYAYFIELLSKQVHCTIKKSLCQKYCDCIVFLLSSSASSLTLRQLLIQ
ncbi:hypothetical protein [Streptococcus pneumoniae]|uniref:hypothetical protein n=1 Tax=Streptococcus pneumoniae TaxID=1313 RepID=UPI0005E649B0|nr:hypothetical protein [Streptococcus pneumoniae]CFB99746.1 Uncharacterised protein [Streptococcus pneumoniae]CKE42686.1 Uncharacterised protein [Streptococcus pneumoniae]COF46336.1 Uncharacterised protein [Streptococcus pneumoniae]